MITVTREKERISIAGHANYAEPGKDIVCSAISTLVYTLKDSIKELAQDCVSFSFYENGVIIAFENNISEQTELLLNSFIIGIRLIACDYPDNVELVRA